MFVLDITVMFIDPLVFLLQFTVLNGWAKLLSGHLFFDPLGVRVSGLGLLSWHLGSESRVGLDCFGVRVQVDGSGLRASRLALLLCPA